MRPEGREARMRPEGREVRRCGMRASLVMGLIAGLVAADVSAATLQVGDRGQFVGMTAGGLAALPEAITSDCPASALMGQFWVIGRRRVSGSS
jgi:hypothetical protein